MLKSLRTLRCQAAWTVLAAGLATAVAAAPAGGLPFLENNYAQALSDARNRHVPLFVEVWAPW